VTILRCRASPEAEDRSSPSRGSKHVGVRVFVDRLEHSDPEGGPIKTETTSDLELARWVAHVLNQAVDSLSGRLDGD
jgi:hypothetical protein